MRMRIPVVVLMATVAIGAAIYFGMPAPRTPEEPLAAQPPLAPPQNPPISAGGQPANTPASAIPGPAGTAVGTAPQQLAAEQARQDEQDAQEAIELLHDPDPGKRVQAAEQLSAYQTAQSQAELVQALRGDAAAAVREAAAQSLVLFEEPAHETWSALLAALEDASPDVQSAAVATLETLLMQYDEKPSRVAWVRKAIKDSVTSRKLARDTREAMESMIEQWEDAEASP